MNQFLLRQGISRELQLFPHIVELALKKNNAIQLDSLHSMTNENLLIYYVIDGKFEWIINEQPCVLYPGDAALILPGQSFGGEKGFLEIGTLSWLNIKIEKWNSNGLIVFGGWSNLSGPEQMTIGKIFVVNKKSLHFKFKGVGGIFESIREELSGQQVGYVTRVNHLIDGLIILLARHLTHQKNSQRDFPLAFLKLEQALRQRLYHQWTVEEMAALVGMGATAFNEKVKNYSGFSPLNYLINIRISEAIKLLKRPGANVTSIALSTGFYSSQHFATTFKKLTGLTPSEFRKSQLPKK